MISATGGLVRHAMARARQIFAMAYAYLPKQRLTRYRIVRRAVRAGARPVKAIKRYLPKGLYIRSLLIVIVPMVILQSVVAFVFMERHWERVTRRLSEAVSQDIAALIAIYKAYPDTDNYARLIDIARQNLELNVSFLPGQDLPPAGPKPFFSLLDQTLSKEITREVGRPFWIDTVGRSNLVEIRIKLDDAVMRVFAKRTHTYASNSHIFLIWMVATALVLILVALLFLRNQIKPILSLAQAADSFGRGRDVPDFHPRGAQEVRQAAAAFMKMRERIERQIEQRTTMLAGVSHDLRTVLTRFKLQLALLDARGDMAGLMADVAEMQHMLEDYLAFARGDQGEQVTTGSIEPMLEEIRREAAGHGKTARLSVSGSMEVSLRMGAFKRCLTNLVHNGMKHGQAVAISAVRDKDHLTIHVDDDGPGVPEAEREAVFRPFYRLDSARNQNTGGTGLGLAIARDIVRSHGGEIRLSQSPMGGLRVTAVLPV